MHQIQHVIPNHWARKWLIDHDLPEWSVSATTIFLDLFILSIIIIVTDWLSRKILLSLVNKWVKHSKNKWDDYFYEQRVFKNLAHLLPAIIAYFSITIIFEDFPKYINFLENLTKIYIGILFVLTLNKALRAIENLVMDDEKLSSSPIRTVSQVIRILNFFGLLIFIISVLTGVGIASIVGIVAGTSAILILIFQDTITGLLANFQITMYDLLRIGDWVTLDKYGVDGDVISIDLTTVKVRNFDKTISSVPAKAFVNDSFVNWRGMREEGARRIKRNILIDISSVSYCSHQDIERFSQVQLISDYVVERQTEIDDFNAKHSIDTSLRINGRRQTNIGVYRQYVLKYLQRSSRVNQSFPIMVRQLQPTAQGIPIEVYCFAATTVWEEYEGVQADIFDHLYAATPFFGLRLFQSPAGEDVRFLASSQKQD